MRSRVHLALEFRSQPNILATAYSFSKSSPSLQNGLNLKGPALRRRWENDEELRAMRDFWPWPSFTFPPILIVPILFRVLTLPPPPQSYCRRTWRGRQTVANVNLSAKSYYVIASMRCGDLEYSISLVRDLTHLIRYKWDYGMRTPGSDSPFQFNSSTVTVVKCVNRLDETFTLSSAHFTTSSWKATCV